MTVTVDAVTVNGRTSWQALCGACAMVYASWDEGRARSFAAAHTEPGHPPPATDYEARWALLRPACQAWG